MKRGKYIFYMLKGVNENNIDYVGRRTPLRGEC